jgi:hypothetical protein
MLRICLAALSAAAIASAQAPVVTGFNDTGNGMATVNWTASSSATDYLVSAEGFSFTETLPGGGMTPGGVSCLKEARAWPIFVCRCRR